MTIIGISLFWIAAIVVIYYFFEYKNHRRMLVPFVLTLTAISVAIVHIFLLSVSKQYSLYLGGGNLDMPATGQVGDFLGGVIGTIAGALSVILLYKTLKVQIDFNKKQKEDLAIERFENKFYEMLKIHRDNVDQISINNNVSGRKAFSRLFNELRFTYYYCVNNITEQRKSNIQIQLSDEKIYNIAYLVFFFGTGQISDSLVKDLLDKDSITVFNHITETIKIDKELHRNDKTCKSLKTVSCEGEKISFYYNYVPFQGHMGNLSHYVRHLYQLIRFVDEKYPETEASDAEKNKKSKEDYVATIRSQLSIYEQAFLYYNAISVLGAPWLDSEKSEGSLLKKYSIIKNLPKPLADFYKTPDEVFGTNERNEGVKLLFEWTEIKERYKDIDKEKVTL